MASQDLGEVSNCPEFKALMGKAARAWLVHGHEKQSDGYAHGYYDAFLNLDNRHLEGIRRNYDIGNDDGKGDIDEIRRVHKIKN